MSSNVSKTTMIVSALLPVIAAIVLCIMIFDIRSMAEHARLWALSALGGQPGHVVGLEREGLVQASTHQVNNAYESLAKDLEQQVKAKEVTIERGEGTLEIRFIDKVLFHSGSADITEQGQAILAKTGNVLKNFEQQYFAILGHTDNIPVKGGTYASNWELSTARACSVVRFLSGASAISPERFYAIGRGEYEPAMNNDTEIGRAGNRRVEILVTDMKSLRQLKRAPGQPSNQAGASDTAHQ